MPVPLSRGQFRESPRALAGTRNCGSEKHAAPRHCVASISSAVSVQPRLTPVARLARASAPETYLRSRAEAPCLNRARLERALCIRPQTLADGAANTRARSTRSTEEMRFESFFQPSASLGPGDRREAAPDRRTLAGLPDPAPGASVGLGMTPCPESVSDMSPCLDRNVRPVFAPSCQHLSGQWVASLIQFGMIDASGNRESNSAEVVT